MGMSSKDYKLIASVLRAHAMCTPSDFFYGDVGYVLRYMENTRRHIAEDLANELAKDNRAFDRKRFLHTCGVYEREEVIMKEEIENG